MTERRYTETAEIRMTTDSGRPVFEIQGIVFDVWSQNLGGFKEMIKRSAWDTADTADIRALFNHNPDYVLGRNAKAGTLLLDVRSDSVWGIVTPPDTQWARDLAVSVERGDISGSSFAFRTADKGDKWDLTKPVAERTVTAFSLVRDFSVVTYPAYTQTNSAYAVRSALHAIEEQPELIETIPAELRHRIETEGLALPGIAPIVVEQEISGSDLVLTVHREATPESETENEVITHRGLPLSTYQRRLRLLGLHH